MNKHRSLGLLVFFILSSLLFFNSCSRDHKTVDSEFVFSAKLVKPVDAVDLKKRLKAELVRRYERIYTGYMYYYDFGMSTGGGTGPSTGGSTSGGTGADSTISTIAGTDSGTEGSSSLAFSETNNQEQGVDEGDIVKTDGSYIYLARGSRFLILKASPADQAAIVSNIDLKQPISELHLSGSLVTLVSNTYNYQVKTSSAETSLMQSTYFTQVSLYDAATPTAPTLTANFVFPGIAQGSRRINDTIYLVMNHSIDLAFPATPWDYLAYPYDQNSFQAAVAQALAENKKRIEALTLDDLLPSYTRTLYTGGIAGSPLSGPIVNYQDVYIPEFGNGTDISVVVSLDISKQDPSPASSGVLSSWCRIYMNTESLYLASDNNWWWIEPLSDAAAPQQNPEPRTAVHKFSVDTADGKPVYRGSGMVDGWVNDRFSMSDYQGYLRIGTTRGGWWGETRSNQLAVLSEDDGKLVEKGKITGLAPGESIYSMRYDGDRGYMVTFRQTDPLFTLDLSDPANPKVAGEIKVNGFATYIHLIDGNNSNKQLLTIGPSADDTGRLSGGNKLQLFEVTDLANPTLLSTYELGSGWSNAVYDPHAFLYYQGLLTIPYYNSTYTAGTSTTINGINFYSEGTYTYTSGLNVFNIEPASINLRGMISAPTITSGYGSYKDTVDRSVIIGADIFSIAHRSITVAGSDLLDVKKVVELPESYSYYYPCCWVGTGIGGIAVGGGGGGSAGFETTGSVQIPDQPVSVITTTTASTEPAQPSKIE